MTPSVSGGRASWTVQCDASGNVYASGYVKDTSADGKCASVLFKYPDGSTWITPNACPKDDQKNFSSPARPGRILDGYLRVL